MQHMRMLGGPEAQIHFTHLSKLSSTSLARSFDGSLSSEPIAQAFAHNIGVLDLMKKSSVPLEKVCLLDPKAEKELSPDDGDGRFEWFLFGVRFSHLIFRLRANLYCKLGHPWFVRWKDTRTNPVD